VPFAIACVVGELKRHLRDTSWRLHVPRPLKEQALRMCRAADELHQSLGHAPTSSELAAHLEVDEEQILEAWAAMTSRRELSLDQPPGDDTDVCLGDLIAAPRAREEPENLLALPGMVGALPALEREVIVLRFFQDLDQYEIAARVGFSQMHVSGLQRRALARMHVQLWSRDLWAGPWPGSPVPVRQLPAVGGLTAVRRARKGRWEWMQVMWTVTVTLILALSGVLALALVAHVGDRARRR